MPYYFAATEVIVHGTPGSPTSVRKVMSYFREQNNYEIKFREPLLGDYFFPWESRSCFGEKITTFTAMFDPVTANKINVLMFCACRLCTEFRRKGRPINHKKASIVGIW